MNLYWDSETLDWEWWQIDTNVSAFAVCGQGTPLPVHRTPRVDTP